MGVHEMVGYSPALNICPVESDSGEDPSGAVRLSSAVPQSPEVSVRVGALQFAVIISPVESQGLTFQPGVSTCRSLDR